jgi:hypothetical protein
MRRLGLALLIAALVSVFGVGTTAYSQAVPTETMPATIDAHVVIQSGGTFYVLHDGVKFEMPTVELTNAQVLAIPDASAAQWQEHFATEPTGDLAVPPVPRGPGEPY